MSSPMVYARDSKLTFSRYSTEGTGILDGFTGSLLNTSVAGPADNGRYPVIDPYKLDTTDKAAVAAYEIIQGFYDGLGELDGEVKSSKFSLWTEYEFFLKCVLYHLMTDTHKDHMEVITVHPFSTISNNRTRRFRQEN